MVNRTHNFIIPALVAGLLAGCSGGSTTPGAAGTAPAMTAATVGSATTWTSAKWGGGGYVTGVIYHPVNSSLLYARTDVGGAYRWNATDSTWTPITDGIGWGPNEGQFHEVESLALDPNNDQFVYMVTGDGATSYPAPKGRIYISSDRGTTWTHYDLPFAVGGNDDGRAYGERLSIDPELPSIMYYATRQDGLWKSTDSGHTWNQVTSLSSIRLTNGGQVYGTQQVVFDTSNRGTGTQTWVMWATVNPDYAKAAGLTSSLYESTNGGATWAPVEVPSAVSGYYIPHVVRAADGYFYFAFNQTGGQGRPGPGFVYKFGGGAHGGTWTQLLSTTGMGVGGLAVNGTGSTTRIAVGMTSWSDSSKQIQVSDDAGLNWHEVEANMPHTSDDCKGWIEGVTIDPANRDHIMHIHGGGICETTNASSATPTWSPKVNNLEETATLAAVAAPAGAPYKLINSAGDIGTWLVSDLTTRPTKGPMNWWSSGNAADLAWADTSYIAATGVDNANGHVVKAFWSGDAGNTWSQFASLPTGGSASSSQVQSVAVTSRNNLVWAPQDSVPSYSTNSGATWTQTNLPAFTATWNGYFRAYRLAADRVNPSKVYAFDSGGANWSGQPGKVYISYDGGHSFGLSGMWGAQNMTPNGWGDTSMVVNPNAEGDIWVTDGNSLYHSVNSGWNWVQVGSFASANGTMGATKVALGKAQAGSSYSAAIYVEGTLNGQWGIFHSDDGGVTWSRWNDDMHQFGGNAVMVGDWNTYGRIYVNGAARGLIYSN
ncbi:dockerin [Massilia sp. TW-1]|uniref:Dockerin n=1 Tax=Telluria antibiotica TaxID=2717319 RepID=A0ABX0P6I5_9BURK|nr:dockerin [Telluria antibiotica]